MKQQDRDWLLDRVVPGLEKYKAAHDWLRRFENENIGGLRQASLSPAKFSDLVTILAYVFYSDERDFEQVEFSILHTWRVFGKIPVVLIVDRITSTLSDFRDRHPAYVRFALSPLLKAGDGNPMSVDCVLNLHRYFDTPYCLIIQGDGFPLRDGLESFLGRYDYIGAPAVRATWREAIADLLLRDCLNGGFCLRSKRCCEIAAREGRKVGFRVDKSVFVLEDDFYCRITRYNIFNRLKLRFPWAWEARRFSVIDIYGTIDVLKLKNLPLGAHGPTTLFQYQDYLCEAYGYQSVPLYR